MPWPSAAKKKTKQSTRVNECDRLSMNNLEQHQWGPENYLKWSRKDIGPKLNQGRLWIAGPFSETAGNTDLSCNFGAVTVKEVQVESLRWPPMCLQDASTFS
mmetsp:Transcript_66842/g.118609  ORF Transcript_66842/g.118609 Transcript_66842/m.118609 type:complete len:102 (+) Transcript_66842:64-369(+)